MPTPIASRADDPYRSWESSSDDDLTCKESPLDAAELAAGGQRATSASTESQSPSSEKAEPGVCTLEADAYARDGDVYASAFALRGRDPSGVEVEVFSASARQDKRQGTVQVAMARIGGSTDDLHWSARGEVLTAQVHTGFDNADGSTGLGASMGATLVGGEVTGTLGPVSLTVGGSIGSTFGYSMGSRDSDHDGQIEYCGRVDFGLGSVGACVEDRR